MTQETIAAILRTIRLGLHPDRAAQAHGISPGTMRAHKKRHPEFATAIKEAEAAAENTFLGRIMQHTERQWTAAAWMLERRWPDRWAKRDPDLVAAAKLKPAGDGPTVPNLLDLKVWANKLADYAKADSE